MKAGLNQGLALVQAQVTTSSSSSCVLGIHFSFFGGWKMGKTRKNMGDFFFWVEFTLDRLRQRGTLKMPILKDFLFPTKNRFFVDIGKNTHIFHQIYLSWGAATGFLPNSSFEILLRTFNPEFCFCQPWVIPRKQVGVSPGIF